jgi:hypothetical protein
MVVRNIPRSGQMLPLARTFPKRPRKKGYARMQILNKVILPIEDDVEKGTFTSYRVRGRNYSILTFWMFEPLTTMAIRGITAQPFSFLYYLE